MLLYLKSGGASETVQSSCIALQFLLVLRAAFPLKPEESVGFDECPLLGLTGIGYLITGFFDGSLEIGQRHLAWIHFNRGLFGSEADTHPQYTSH